MTKADEYKRNAENCLDLVENASSLPDKARYARMARAWQDLAETQASLDAAPRLDSSDMRN